MIEFEIPGEPRGKGRPRFARSGHAYTPSETVAYEKLVRACWYKAAGAIKPDDRPIELEIVARYGVPKSISKRRRAEMLAGEEVPMKKPDYDNIGKIVTDALNKAAYEDDKQVVRAYVNKIYSESPSVTVRVKPLTRYDYYKQQPDGSNVPQDTQPWVYDHSNFYENDNAAGYETNRLTQRTRFPKRTWWIAMPAERTPSYWIDIDGKTHGEPRR